MDESAPVEAPAEPSVGPTVEPSVDPSVATVEAPGEAPEEAPDEAPEEAAGEAPIEAPVKAAPAAEKVARDQVEFDEGEPSEGDEGMGEETMEEIERQRKLQKREQRKMQQEKLDKHFRQEEIGTTVDSGEEEREEEQEKEKEPEPAVQLNRNTIEALKSFVLDDEEFRTGVSSDSEDTEYMKDEPGSSFKDDFMQNFYFPSMSDCSTPSSDHIAAKLASTEEKESTKDKSKTSDTRGRSSTSLVDEQAANYEDEHMGEGDDDDDDESSTSSTILSWPCALDNIGTEVKLIEEEDTGYDMFFEMHTEGEVRKESVSKLEAAKRALEIAEIVNVFLNNTIDDAVNAALFMGPGKAFAAKVSLMKLYDLLYDAVESYILIKQFNKDVNAKMFDYYRRIGQMRVFDQLTPRLTRIEHDRFKEALYKLDYLKERAVMTKKTTAALLSSVKLDLEHVYSIAQASDESLEECMRKTIVRKDAEHLPRIVETELRRMRAIRNEISDSRIWLITRQHTLGRILERKHNFDQITETLTMDQFIVTQAEVISLETKLEERNIENANMRHRCTKHIHQLAFIHEKSSMLSANLEISKHVLQAQTERRDKLRDQLHHLKLEHASLKIQKTDMHDKCGLLFKPALLYDYDDTHDFVMIKREKVKKYKNIISDLERRIAHMEKRSRESYIPGSSEDELLSPQSMLGSI